jgi:quinol-cytochrome oxidoreductase complex cytochrome b subunit
MTDLRDPEKQTVERHRDGLEPSPHPAIRTNLVGRVRQSEAWQSVFRHPPLDTPRGRALQSFSNVFLHLYPVRVPAKVLRNRYSWRLGFISSVLFMILVSTGVYLMFFYSPSVGSAYGDMQLLRTGVGFGQLIRNVHRWAAHLMVLVTFLHLCRVFYAGAYKRPRQFNWVLGMGLFLATLGFSFTGYLLPWDQLSYWAVTVGTNLANYVPVVGSVVRDLLIGGEQIGQATLERFYALHVAVLPISLVLLLTVHIWRVRKDGFAVERGGTGPLGDHMPGDVASNEPVVYSPVLAQDPALAGTARVRLLGIVDRESVVAEQQLTDDTVFAWPHLMVRHAVYALGTAAVCLALGVMFAAPLQGIANPNLTPEPAKAPWYFVGLQELLSHFDPLVAGILIPGAAVMALVALPYIDRNSATEARNRKVAIVIFSTIVAIAVTLTVIGLAFRGPGWKIVNPLKHSYIEM